ncbi:WD40-repeat-containing domain protein [Suillus ampliporus]|nr:WD40-repeat-containing domain protein [Suillus ampliporus]
MELLGIVSNTARNAYFALKERLAPAQTMRGQLAPSRIIQGHTEKVSAAAFFNDGRRVVTGSTDHTLQIWDMQEGRLVGGPFTKHKAEVLSVAVSSDDRRVVSGGVDPTVIVWDAESKQIVCNLVKHTDWVCSVCFSPDGIRLASGSMDSTVIIWNAMTGAIVATLHHHSSVYSVAFSPDGLKVASGSADCAIWVWHTEYAQLLCKINAHEHWVRSVVWSPDCQQLISASYDRTVKFWNPSTALQIGQPCTGHTDSINSLAISFDGSFIATAADDKTVRLWCTKTHKQIGKALEHTAWVSCAAICPNGALLVSGDDKKKVLLWLIKENVIKHNLSSYGGNKVEHAALHSVQHYDEATEAFNIVPSTLDDAPDPQIRQLRQQHVNPSEVEDVIQRAIHAQLENAPLRLLNTFTGRLCDRRAQINAFMESTEYNELLSSSVTHAPLQTELIEGIEPLLHDMQDKVVYEVKAVGSMGKLQSFCQVARDAGHHWAWCDTCCMDQNNNVELQRSVNSMFVWYCHSALTIVYLSDTVPELLAPRIILFYQADWTLYFGDRSPNHKQSVTIMMELEDATGIDARALVAFRPGMTSVREKLKWASSRLTTPQEDIAYSLFGIFGIHSPVTYGEMKQKALGRLLQEIVAQSGDITALDWVGKSSEFNSCLPADIAAYTPPPCTSQTEAQSRPRVIFNDVKEDGLQDLVITTEDGLIPVSPTRPTRQTFLLIRPWNRHSLELPDFSDETESVDSWSKPRSPSNESRSSAYHRDNELVYHSRALRLIVRLGQPFGALLLAQQRFGEYKRIASDNNIIAQAKDVASVHNMMDVRTLEIL